MAGTSGGTAAGAAAGTSGGAAAGTAAITAAVLSQPLGCLIESDRTAELGASIVGTIDEVKVERGDAIKKGEVLATLRSDVERANVAAGRERARNEGEIKAAQALRENASEKMRSTAKLFELGAAGQLEVEQSRNDFAAADGRYTQAVQNRRTAEAELSVAEAQLAQRTIRSPFDAVVVDRLVQPGERVDGKPMFRIAALSPLRVEVVAPTALYGQFREGMAMTVIPDFPGAPPMPAQIARIDRLVDAASGTFRARLQMPNPRGDIPAGLRCKVVWDGQKGASAIRSGNVK